MQFESHTVETVERAGLVLEDGGLIVTPSETNYSLVCDPENAVAVAKVFEVKRRTKFGPLTLAIAEPSQADRYVDYPPRYDRERLLSLWPGLVTLVLPKRYPFPTQLTMGAPTLGVLCHGDCALTDIVKAFGPVAVTSANLSGQGDIFVDRDKAAVDLGEDVDLMIEAVTTTTDPLEIAGGVNRSNTIVDLTLDRPYLVRPGRVPVAEVMTALPDLVTDPDRYREILERRLSQALEEVK